MPRRNAKSRGAALEQRLHKAIQQADRIPGEDAVGALSFDSKRRFRIGCLSAS